MASTAGSFRYLTQLIRSQGHLLVDAISAILLSKDCLLACLVVEQKEDQSDHSPVHL